MARAGQVIENPRRRETVRFLQVGADSAGRLLEMWIEAEPSAAAPPLHSHPRQEERFEVISGQVTYEIDGVRRTANSGERVVISPGAVHTWWNGGPDILTMHAQLEPALRFETLLETMYGLQRSGRTNSRGVPNPLQAAVIFDAFAGEWIAYFLPRPVRVVLIPLLAVVGRTFGFRSWYPEFSPEGPVPDPNPKPVARS